MIEEKGQVTAVDGTHVWVLAERESGCGACLATSGCGISVLAKALGGRSVQVRVVNSVNAKIGDSVLVGVPDEFLLKGSFAVYATPLASMILFSILGRSLAQDPQISELLSIILGGLGLAAGFLWLRRYTRQVSTDLRYQPVIVRKLIGASPISDLKTGQLAPEGRHNPPDAESA